MRNRISAKDFAVEKAKEPQWLAEKKYELVHNDQLASAVGLAKTHDVFLKFGPPAPDAAKQWRRLRGGHALQSLLRYFWSTGDPAVGEYLKKLALQRVIDQRWSFFYGAAGVLLGNTRESSDLALSSANSQECILWQANPDSVEQMALDDLISRARGYRVYDEMRLPLHGLPHLIYSLNQAGITQAAILESMKKK